MTRSDHGLPLRSFPPDDRPILRPIAQPYRGTAPSHPALTAIEQHQPTLSRHQPHPAARPAPAERARTKDHPALAHLRSRLPARRARIDLLRRAVLPRQRTHTPSAPRRTRSPMTSPTTERRVVRRLSLPNHRQGRVTSVVGSSLAGTIRSCPGSRASLVPPGRASGRPVPVRRHPPAACRRPMPPGARFSRASGRTGPPISLPSSSAQPMAGRF